MTKTDWDSRVHAAVTDLRADGKKVTRDAVMALIGGNPRTIGALVKKYAAGQGAQPSSSTHHQMRAFQHEVDQRVASLFQSQAVELIRQIGETAIAREQDEKDYFATRAELDPQIAFWERRLERIQCADKRASARSDDAYHRERVARDALKEAKQAVCEADEQVKVLGEKISATKAALAAVERDEAALIETYSIQMADLNAWAETSARDRARAEELMRHLSQGRDATTENQARLAALEAALRGNKAG